MHANELHGADFVGYDGPPAIVAKPGETITVPVFVSHFSDRTFEPKLRWWVDGYDDRADIDHRPRRRRASRSTWRPYDVTEQRADPRSRCPTGRSSAR